MMLHLILHLLDMAVSTVSSGGLSCATFSNLRLICHSLELEATAARQQQQSGSGSSEPTSPSRSPEPTLPLPSGSSGKPCSLPTKPCSLPTPLVRGALQPQAPRLPIAHHRRRARSTGPGADKTTGGTSPPIGRGAAPPARSRVATLPAVRDTAVAGRGAGAPPRSQIDIYTSLNNVSLPPS